ncbi:hypothetical protein [Acidiphilium sp.]|uniref:hypothetical protein n=1 Tax=Acidiphilium sp. TaxID=527 RepID=UPI002585362C|nr:hypothetical protein [Acidiphilium sp.]
MALTRETFRGLPNRHAAFTLLATNLRWRMRVIGERLLGWIDSRDAGRPADEVETRRQDLLDLAREMRAELDVLIGELEDSAAIRAREAA